MFRERIADGRRERPRAGKYQRAADRISADAYLAAIVDIVTEQSLGAVDLAGFEQASVGTDVRDYGLEPGRLSRPTQRQIRKYDLRPIDDLLALLDAACPVPRIDALVSARQIGTEGKVERLINRELRDESDAGGELIADFAKDIDAAKAELVGKRSRSPATVVDREQAAIEVDVDGLEPGQQSAQKTGAVSVLSHRSREIQCQTRGRRLGVAEPARNSERAGAVSFTSEAEGVRIPQHVVGSSKVEAGPEPRRDGR